MLGYHCVTQCWKTEIIAVPIVKMNVEAISGLLKGKEVGNVWAVKPDFPVSQDISNHFHPFWYRIAMDGDIPIGLSNILR